MSASKAQSTGYADVGVSGIDYSSLSGPDSIRLVRLAPYASADESSDVQCELLEVQLSTAPDYEALSYEWGQRRKAGTHILINGKQATVRQNLKDALALFSKESNNSRLVWVDAICINQSNLKERNSQVAMLKDIYTQATSVLAWTGKEHYHDRFAMQGLKMILDNEVPELPSALAPQHVFVKDFAGWLQRSYWSRLWILQECVLAKELYVYYGSTRISWSDLHTAIELFPHQGAEYVFMISSCVSKIDSYRQGHLPLDLHEPYWEAHRPAREAFLLKDLLKSFSSLGCSDPRDRVYGLLALADDTAGRLTVDYNKTLSELFVDLVDLYRGEKDLLQLAQRFHAYLCGDNELGATSKDTEPVWLCACFDTNVKTVQVFRELSEAEVVVLDGSPGGPTKEPRAILRDENKMCSHESPGVRLLVNPTQGNFSMIVPDNKTASSKTFNQLAQDLFQDSLQHSPTPVGPGYHCLKYPVRVDQMEECTHPQGNSHTTPLTYNHLLIQHTFTHDPIANNDDDAVGGPLRLVFPVAGGHVAGFAYGPPSVRSGDIICRFLDTTIALLMRMDLEVGLKLIAMVSLDPVSDILTAYKDQWVGITRIYDHRYQDGLIYATAWAGDPYVQDIQDLRLGSSDALWLQLDHGTLRKIVTSPNVKITHPFRRTLVYQSMGVSEGQASHDIARASSAHGFRNEQFTDAREAGTQTYQRRGSA